MAHQFRQQTLIPTGDEYDSFDVPLAMRASQDIKLEHLIHGEKNQWQLLGVAKEVATVAWIPGFDKDCKITLNDWAKFLISETQLEISGLEKSNSSFTTAYRQRSEALRWASMCEFIDEDYRLVLKELLADLFLSQTLPESELMSNPTIDRYTGEPDPEYQTEIAANAAITSKMNSEDDQFIQSLDNLDEAFRKMVPEGQVAQQVKIHDDSLEQSIASAYRKLCWKELRATFRELKDHMREARRTRGKQIIVKYEKQIQQAIRAQGALVDDDDEQVYDDRGFTPSSLQKSWSPMPWAVDFDVVQKWYDRREEIFRSLNSINQRLTKGNKMDSKTYEAMFHKRIEASPETEELISHLSQACDVIDTSDAGQTKWGIQQVAAIVYKLSGPYGLGVSLLDVEDAEPGVELTRANITFDIRRIHPRLLDIINEFEDEISEMTSTPLGKGPRETQLIGKLDEFEKDTEERIRATMPVTSNNPVQTASWHIGFIRAVANGAKSKEDATKAGWANFRQELDPVAAALYNRAIGEGKEPKEAMRVFWAVHNKNIAKPPKKPTIAGLFTNGIKLSTGRFIDFQIAALKLANNELEITVDEIKRLHDAITKNGIGAGRFTTMLQAKL